MLSHTPGLIDPVKNRLEEEIAEIDNQLNEFFQC